LESFEASGRAGAKEAWRSKAITNDQEDKAASL
jgi:hypothetical protein